MAAVQYSAEFLLYLRQSPLCVKPPGLPPAEEWMGPPPETGRNSQAKTTNDRIKGGDSFLLNQENRRPALDRNGSRNTTNPEDIILGPPRTSFASATTLRNNRNSDADKGLKDGDRQDRTDRFNFRTRTNDSENTNDRFGAGRNSAFRRRGDDQDRDSEGWTPVKPRKSFGNEGSERFQGRMGAAGERFGGSRDTQSKDASDRRNRAQDIRDKDGEDIDTPRRNGLSRGKTDSWFNKENTNSSDNNGASLSVRERIDRSKSWRDREPEDRQNDRYGERAGGYGGGRYDRDRDQRVERDPEWLDEPVEHKSQGHTVEDFKKFMESMKSKNAPKVEEKAPAPLQTNLPDPAFEAEKVLSAPALETGPDKFFAAYGGSLQVSTPTAEKEASKPTSGKGSRFMAFLAPQEGAKTEPSTPAAAAAPSSGQPNEGPQQNEAEKEAFNLLIQKLQKSGLGGLSGPSGQAAANPMAQLFGGFSQPSQPTPLADPQPKSQVTSPEPFQQYGGERRDDPRFRAPPPNPLHDIISPRPMAPPTQPPPMTRPEQALHDILAQRHAMPNQNNNRGAQNPMMNNQTEFLMRLMQNHKEAPEPPRQELLVRMPQPTKQVNIPDLNEREAEYQRERNAAQRQQQQQQQQQQQIRGPAPPGFFNDQFHPSDVDNRPPQPPTQMPTQILQRPPPPGLDHHMLPFPMAAGGAGNPGSGVGGQPMGPPQRPMIPPPGLVNGPRNGPMPGMFPMNFPPPGGAFPPGPPPPDGIVGPPPPRGMQPPPGFFGGGPPPGFMGPPPPGMGGFQGPDGGPAGFGGAGGMPFPVDRRGMLPPGYRGP